MTTVAADPTSNPERDSVSPAEAAALAAPIFTRAGITACMVAAIAGESPLRWALAAALTRRSTS